MSHFNACHKSNICHTPLYHFIFCLQARFQKNQMLCLLYFGSRYGSNIFSLYIFGTLRKISQSKNVFCVRVHFAEEIWSVDPWPVYPIVLVILLRNLWNQMSGFFLDDFSHTRLNLFDLLIFGFWPFLTSRVHHVIFVRFSCKISFKNFAQCRQGKCEESNSRNSYDRIVCLWA